MTVVSMNNLLEAGVHFGHQKRRWNPKMKEYIFESRDDIYIIDLQKTVKKLEEAYEALKQIVTDGGRVIFVGTKKQANEACLENATRTNMYYVTERWLGGTLTNFKTIRSRVKRLEELEKMQTDGTFDLLPKKEVALLNKEYEKLNRYLNGIREMKELPKAMIVVDPKQEEIAIREAKKLGIKTFGIVDTNCDPEVLDYPIPGNDDAVRAVKIVLNALTNAIATVNGNEVIDVITDEEPKESLKKNNRRFKDNKNERNNNKQKKNNSETEVKEDKKISETEVEPEVNEEIDAELEEKKEADMYDKNIKKLTLNELKELAKERGVKGFSKMKKNELLEALK